MYILRKHSFSVTGVFLFFEKKQDEILEIRRWCRSGPGARPTSCLGLCPPRVQLNRVGAAAGWSGRGSSRGRVASLQRGSTRGPTLSSRRARRCAVSRRLHPSRRRVRAISVRLAFRLVSLHFSCGFRHRQHGAVCRTMVKITAPRLLCHPRVAAMHVLGPRRVRAQREWHGTAEQRQVALSRRRHAPTSAARWRDLWALISLYLCSRPLCSRSVPTARISERQGAGLAIKRSQCFPAVRCWPGPSVTAVCATTTWVGGGRQERRRWSDTTLRSPQHQG
jgi:hypothetical protein